MCCRDVGRLLGAPECSESVVGELTSDLDCAKLPLAASTLLTKLRDLERSALVFVLFAALAFQLSYSAAKAREGLSTAFGN